jgi:hypothetical protein
MIMCARDRRAWRRIARSPPHRPSFEAAIASIVSDLPHHQLSQRPGAIAITLDKVAAGCEQMQRDCIAGRHAQIASLLVDDSR